VHLVLVYNKKSKPPEPKAQEGLKLNNLTRKIQIIRHFLKNSLINDLCALTFLETLSVRTDTLIFRGLR